MFMVAASMCFKEHLLNCGHSEIGLSISFHRPNIITLKTNGKVELWYLSLYSLQRNDLPIRKTEAGFLSGKIEL